MNGKLLPDPASILYALERRISGRGGGRSGVILTSDTCAPLLPHPVFQSTKCIAALRLEPPAAAAAAAAALVHGYIDTAISTLAAFQEVTDLGNI